MVITAPEWLVRHGGDVHLMSDGASFAVLLSGQPQYLLTPMPARGRYACRILQTINSKRLDDDTIWASWDEAVRGGLEELRQKLGW
jgi:hypothetical protein